MNPSHTGNSLTFIGSIFVTCLSHRNSRGFPRWNIGVMEYWNDGLRRRKTKNLLFPILIPTIPLSQQSIIPILQKITLMNNGVLQRPRKLHEMNMLTGMGSSSNIGLHQIQGVMVHIGRGAQVKGKEVGEGNSPGEITRVHENGR